MKIREGAHFKNNVRVTEVIDALADRNSLSSRICIFIGQLSFLDVLFEQRV